MGILAGVIVLAVVLVVVMSFQGTRKEEEDQETEPAAITVWYEDEDYAAFLVQCARDFHQETGIEVLVERQTDPEYLEAVYQATMEDGDYPDVYLSSTDQLEKCVLSGIAAANEREQDYLSAGVCEKAVEASRYEEAMYGSPVGFTTVVLAVHSGYFTERPQTMMDMVSYASEHEFDNEEEALFMWQVNDILTNYCFISNYISLEEARENGYANELPEAVTEAYDALGNLWKTAAVSEEDTKEDLVAAFNENRTMCAFLGSCCVRQLEDGYEIWELPPLTENIPVTPMSVVDTLLVNPYSQEKEAATAFADFAALEDNGRLLGTSAGMPLMESLFEEEEEKLIFAQFLASDMKPAEMEAESFLSYLQADFLENTDLYTEEE